MSIGSDLPRQLLTVKEFADLGEDELHRWELQEGLLAMAPRPSPDHNLASGGLWAQIVAQLPEGLRAVQDVDVDLQLSPDQDPGWVRRPDIVVVEQSEIDRVRAEGGVLRASAVTLVVEIVSPGSRRADHVMKRAEYADAGIAHYWIVDMVGSASLTALRLGTAGEYVAASPATGAFTDTQPFPVRVDLWALR